MGREEGKVEGRGMEGKGDEGGVSWICL